MYEFTDIITKNGKIIGYMVQGENRENKKFLRMEEAVKFAREKEVTNVSLGIRNGNLYIKGNNCSLKETLPSVSFNNAIASGLIRNFEGIDIPLEPKKAITSFKELPADKRIKLERIKNLFANEKIISFNVTTKSGDRIYTCTADNEILNLICGSELGESKFKDIDFSKVKEETFFPNDNEVRVMDLNTGIFIKIPLSKINSYSIYYTDVAIKPIIDINQAKGILKSNRFVEIVYFTKGKRIKNLFCTLENHSIRSTGCDASKIDSLQSRNENGMLIVFDHAVSDWRALHVKGIVGLAGSQESKLTVDNVDNILKTKVRLMVKYLGKENKLEAIYCTIQPDLFKNSDKAVYDFINEYKSKKDNGTFLLYDLGRDTFIDIPFNRIVSLKNLQSNVKILNKNRKVAGK